MPASSSAASGGRGAACRWCRTASTASASAPPSGEAGAAELVTDGRHALLLHHPGDSAELAGAIRRVLNDRGLAQRLARAGRDLAERCSWAANAARAGALVDREMVTPRALVLATDAWGV